MKRQKAGKYVRILFMLLCFGTVVLYTPGWIEANANDAYLEAIYYDDPGAAQLTKGKTYSGGEWFYSDGKKYYRRKSGKLVKNTWCMIDGDIYCFNAKGYVKTGRISYKEKQYYADSEGRLQINCMVQIGTKVYYYGDRGYMIKNKWKTFKGKTYYFTRMGYMAKNTWVGNRYMGEDGALVKSETVRGRVVDSSGVLVSPSSTDKYIFVGASRIVDMGIAVDDEETIFIAKSGQGYRWLKNYAYGKLKRYLKQNPGCTVIFNLGNNDLKNVNKYISFYRKLIKQYPKAKFYFLDTLPGKGKRAGSNAKRQIFNRKMRAAFGKKCIRGYDYLKATGFSTIDGLHFSPETSRKVYRYVMKAVS